MRRLFPVTDETADATGRDGAVGRAAPGEAGAVSGAGSRTATAGDDREWGLHELADAYAYPAQRRQAGRGSAWLRANMVSTLDGAGQHDGRSGPISSAADMRIFGVLRALADVVIVGAQTARQEGYRPARARKDFAERRAAAGQGPAPRIAVVSAGLDLDFSLPLFTSPVVPTLVITGAGAPRDRLAAARLSGAEVVIAGTGVGVEPVAVVDALVERGLTRLLLEGGPSLLGQFVAEQQVDELCLTLSPLLASGKAQRIAGGPALPEPERLRLVSVLEDSGFLFTRYRRPGPEA